MTPHNFSYSANTLQRGIGNCNAMKMAKCIIELERIYGIKNGGDRKSDGNNFALKTQSDLAKQLNISQSQLINYKKLTTLIPELLDPNNSLEAKQLNIRGEILWKM